MPPRLGVFYGKYFMKYIIWGKYQVQLHIFEPSTAQSSFFKYPMITISVLAYSYCSVLFLYELEHISPAGRQIHG